jgi:hypothetical protein
LTDFTSIEIRHNRVPLLACPAVLKPLENTALPGKPALAPNLRLLEKAEGSPRRNPGRAFGGFNRRRSR